MEHKITIVVSALPESVREHIRQIAEKYGYRANFFDREQDAYEDVRTAEICYGSGVGLMQEGKELRWFHSAAAGVDRFLKPGVMQNEDMVLTGASGAYGVTISEHAVMTTLMLLRRNTEYRQIVAERRWGVYLPIRSIYGSTVTFLGTGDIGTETAGKFRAFGPREIIGVNRSGKCPSPVYDRIVKQEQIAEVLPQTDILIMSLPGTDSTIHFMNAERIAMLPEHAILVNVGRGSTMDQYALADALKAGKLAGAALDVFEKEPLDPEDPLWDCPDLFITPHIAGNMTLPYTVERNAQIFCRNLEDYLNGRPFRRVVDKNIGY